jgi:phage-related tail fiber protein
MNISIFKTSSSNVDDVTTSSVSILVGTVCFFLSSSAPTGWIVCDGSAISRTTYSELFSRIGTTYGVGDGSSTFNIPDFRGTFFRTLNKGNNSYDPDSSTSRQVGSWQDYAQQRITANSSSCQWDYQRQGEYGYGIFYSYRYGGGTDSGGGRDSCSKCYFDSNRQCAGSNSESRPSNISLCACIMY